jgi:solute carrier family 25 phosphate transporter 23/24/25/41
MPEITFNTSSSADTRISSFAPSSRTLESPTIHVGSTNNRSDIPETAVEHLQRQYREDGREGDQVASTSTSLPLIDKVKEIMSDNQLVINTFIAGGLAGATSRTVVSPLERLKIIL